MLHTDGFEYSKRGLVVDGLEIYEDQEPDNNVPYARLSPGEFTWLAGVALDATREKVNKVIKQKQLGVAQTDSGCEVRATGFNALENRVELRTWTVRFDFKKGYLNRLSIGASF